MGLIARGIIVQPALLPATGMVPCGMLAQGEFRMRGQEGGFSHSGSGLREFLVCHQMIKKSCEYAMEVFSLYVPLPSKVVVMHGCDSVK